MAPVFTAPDSHQDRGHTQRSTPKRGPFRSSPAEAVIFDREGFLKRIMGDVDVARTLAEGFLEDMPAQIEQLKTAIATGDIRLAGQQAHRIKGAASNVGGVAVQGVASSMERAGKAADVKTLGSLMPRLEEQFEALRESIKKAWRLQDDP